MQIIICVTNGLYTFPDSDINSDSDLDCKPNGYIALGKMFHTAQSCIQIPILTASYGNGMEIGIRIGIQIYDYK